LHFEDHPAQYQSVMFSAKELIWFRGPPQSFDFESCMGKRYSKCYHMY